MPLPQVPANDLDDIPRAGLAKMTSQNSGIAKWPNNQKRMWAAYYATVTYMDEQLGKILDELERLKLSSSTAIVFLSDHGYHLGEHNFWQKSNLHEEVTRVPVIISAPGLKPGRTQSLAELIDIYPTLCSLLKVPIPKSVLGKSLLPTLRDPRISPRTNALSLNRGSHSLRTDRWAYMKYKNGDEELYDMIKDPAQFSNLAKRNEYQATKSQLLNQLKKELGLSYLFISHDLAVVKYMSDRVMVMKDGQLVELQEADKLYAEPQSQYTKKLIEAIPN